MPDRTEAVLAWLEAVLDRAEQNPFVLLGVKKEVEKKKEVVKEAVKDALLPEFQDYAELIYSTIGS